MSNGTDNFPKMPPYPAKPKATAERAVSPAESVPISEHPDVVTLRRQDHEQACRVTHALMAERDHWKANHANVVARLQIATQRPDLPVDRIPAIKELERLQALLVQPLQQEGGKEESEEMEDPILIPRGLIGAACYLIRKHAPDSKLLGKLREFTVGSRSGYIAPQPSDNLQQASIVQAAPAKPVSDAAQRHAVDKAKHALTAHCETYPESLAALNALQKAFGDQKVKPLYGKSQAIALARHCGASHYRRFTGVEGIQFEGDSFAKFIRALEMPATQPPAQATPEGADMPPPKYESVMAIADEFGSGAIAYTVDEVRTAIAASQQATEPVYGYRMKMADGDYTEWRDCSKAHYDHVLAWPENGGFEVRALYRAAPPSQSEATA